MRIGVGLRNYFLIAAVGIPVTGGYTVKYLIGQEIFVLLHEGFFFQHTIDIHTYQIIHKDSN